MKSVDGEIEIVYMTEFWSPATVYEHGEYGQELVPAPQKPLEFKEHPTGALMAQPTAFGFGSSVGTHFYMQDDRFYESAWQCYLVPYWLPVTAFALLPLFWVANQRRIRNNRRRPAREVAADAANEPARPS